MSDRYPYAVLDAPDWFVSAIDGDPTNGKIRYGRGDRRLRINWRPKDARGSYVASRQRAGEMVPVTIFGKSAESWAYNDHDHTAIGPVDGATFFEVRGEGMQGSEFVDLLARLRLVGADELSSLLPSKVVRPGAMPAVISEMLGGVQVPEGFDASSIPVPAFQERYHVAAHVTSAVGCAWIREYERARSTSDVSAAQWAVDAMMHSRMWPVLREVASSGGWAEEFWRVADDMAAGIGADRLHGRICAS